MPPPGSMPNMNPMGGMNFGTGFGTGQ